MLKNIFAGCAYSYSHGVDQKNLGLLPFYYGLAYSLKARTAVVLGSGGGLVPMIIRQAQRDLGDETAETWLIDGFVPEAGYGHPLESGGWAQVDSTLNKEYPEIKTLRKLTQDCRGLFQEIDFLFIDAEHTYEAVLRDFEVFKTALKPTSVIAFHDTQDEGVQKAVDKIAKDYGFDHIHFRDLASGVSVLRRSFKDGYEKNLYDECATRPQGHRWTLGPTDDSPTWGSGQ